MADDLETLCQTHAAPLRSFAFPGDSTAIRLGTSTLFIRAVFQTINVFLFFVARGNSLPVYQIPMQEIWSAIVHPFGVWTVRSVNAFRISAACVLRIHCTH